MAKPLWFDYVEWDYSEPSFPVMKGLRKNTPKEIVDEYERDQDEFAKAEKMGIIL